MVNIKKLTAHSSRFISTLLIMLIVTIPLSFSGCSSDIIINEPDKMVENAKSLYKKGDTDSAIYQLMIYCDEKPSNTDGYMLLGDWYMQFSDIEKSNASYKTASLNFGCQENQISEADKITSLKTDSDNFSLKIYPNAKYTKNMTLTFSGKNLTPEKSLSGSVNGSAPELKENDDYLTTEWFNIDNSQKYIFLTGNFNCAVWQFADSKNNLTAKKDDGDFRNTTNVRFENKSYSSVEIPDNAVKARVTYYDKSIEYTLPSDDDIFIGYGQTLTGYTNTASKTYEIPDLTENQYISYKNEKWEFFDGNIYKELDWDKISTKKGDFCRISGDLCGVVEITYNETKSTSVNKSLKYGVKYSNKSGISVCQRLGDAKGLNFNYTIDNQWVQEGENDFDNAYPWCEMKLCNIKLDKKGKKTVIYKGENGYSETGSNGNVMVQIPKFYSKRVVNNDYEELWISGKKHSGYSLDPIFKDKNGKELDYVYVGAYLGSESNDKIISAKDKYPTLLLTYGDTLKMAENNGDGFSEMSYFMCSALQRLFVIETGTIDSSSIFSGNTYQYYYNDATYNLDSGLAVFDAKDTNTITVYNNYNTKRIAIGSSITVFKGWDSYKNNNGTQREVTDIKETEKYLEITFDGKPMDIVKEKTAISNIPEKTGKTGKLEYCTGAFASVQGKTSFKYRNIENLYGSALVMLDDDAYMKNGTFYFEDNKGNTKSLDAKIAEQPKDLGAYTFANMDYCIKRMTYDKKNPLIMLPSQVGHGASSHNYYGDYWRYNNENEDVKKYLLYGGSDDNAKLAGLFHLRATIADKDVAFSIYSARIMYR